MSKALLRDDVVSELKKLLIGPLDGEHEVISGRLNLRYFAGILFPQGEKRSSLAEIEVDSQEENLTPEVSSGSEFSGDDDNPLSMANEDLPSSVGLSFTVTKGATVKVTSNAAKYVNEGGAEPANQRWTRKPLAELELEVSATTASPLEAYDGAATIHFLRRPSRFNPDLEIMTVSLVNQSAYKEKDSQLSQTSLRLYQVALSCECSEGTIVPYDGEAIREVALEDQILEMQFSDQPIFAVGHGASCGWIEKNSNAAAKVYIDYMPQANVFRPLFDNVTSDGIPFEDDQIFSLSLLADPSQSKMELLSRLEQFVSFYEKWIENQDLLRTQEFEKPHDFLIREMKVCASRMRKGIEYLKNNHQCWLAFQLANLAMLKQRDQSGYIKNKRAERLRDGKNWPISAIEENPVFLKSLDDILLNKAKWRPFQLAFSLMVLPDLEAEPKVDASEELVDLIWFSTGGGKTEAYMLVSAYELIRRRIRFGDIDKGLGTGVITRYTLRFLTADQFLRTVSLVCAMEWVRLQYQDLLGSGDDKSFSVGLFIGTDNSYGEVSSAIADINKLHQSPENTPHKFPVTECSECGTTLIPSNDDLAACSSDNERASLFGIRESRDRTQIHYVCPNKNCFFSFGTGLPLTSIDDQIYRHPPSIVLGTVDKFAMVAFKERASSLFGSAKCVPPTLIIQDELHLISGPLGTIVALYEAGFETVMRGWFSHHGLGERVPKYIASSATLRDSDTQIQRLMGKASKVFPPRGVRSDDSFFATLEKDPSTARVYLGLMGQALRSTSAAHWASAAILQSVRSQADSHSEDITDFDFLWSLLVYCNSKRELGLINAAVDSEISDRMKAYAAYQKLDIDDVRELSKREVSSTMVESIVDVRNDLTTPLFDRNSSGVTDIVPCTNMISVGVDIDRLGLMLINGQPKTTSEYIQASSRVGRNPIGNGPGLVITLYSPAKPRDRSHYENFVGYHQSIYRFVEPTSVTPGSEQALERAVHAAIVIAVRYSIKSLRKDQNAGRFRSSDSEISRVLKSLRQRLLQAYDDEIKFSVERTQINRYFDDFVDFWNSLAASHDKVHYFSKETPPVRLLRWYGKSGNDPSKPTMTSMRGVDAEIPMKLKN